MSGRRSTDSLIIGGGIIGLAIARELRRHVHPASYRRWGRPGIRAQLLDLRTGDLEMDFVIEKNSRSLHVMNAVSPAFTCALPFAGFVVDPLGGN